MFCSSKNLWSIRLQRYWSPKLLGRPDQLYNAQTKKLGAWRLVSKLDTKPPNVWLRAIPLKRWLHLWNGAGRSVASSDKSKKVWVAMVFVDAKRSRHPTTSKNRLWSIVTIDHYKLSGPRFRNFLTNASSKRPLVFSQRLQRRQSRPEERSINQSKKTSVWWSPIDCAFSGCTK